MLNKKAVSSLTLILLILCSAVLGAFISYFWVMSNYYNMPENTTLLIVESVVFPDFPIFDATYFNVTVLNPSNSVLDVNITAIRLTIEARNEVYFITTAEPSIPFLMQKGTRQVFKCERNWSNFAGETVKIEAVSVNVSTKSHPYVVPRVNLKLTPSFDVSESIEYFNLTIKNSEKSIVNLTISDIRIFGISINVTPPLPSVLSPNETETFGCDLNWEKYIGENVTITAETSEGYESVYMTDRLPGAILQIEKAEFNYTTTTYFDLIVKSLEYSTATADINGINITLPGETPITVPISATVIPNESRRIRCLWNWNSHRNETITVNLHTKQGFTVENKTVRTPPPVIWNITGLNFDLYHTDYFSVNVTNMQSSLQNITITQIKLNENATSFQPQDIPNGEQITFNCTFDWKDSIGENVTITVSTEDGSNVSTTMEVPSVGLKLLGSLVYGNLTDQITNITIPYTNITISNSVNSLIDVTVIRITFESDNKTCEIDNTLTNPEIAPSGHTLLIGENVTIVCLWNWNLHLPGIVKVTVYTAEGFQASQTWQVP